MADFKTLKSGDRQPSNKENYSALYNEARTEYASLINLCRKIINETDSTYPVIYRASYSAVLRSVEMLKNNPFFLTFTVYSTADNYLYSHTANKTVLSLAIGLVKGLKNDELIKLGIAALFHDTGMAKFIPLVRQERKLAEYELDEIKKHVFISCENLDKIADFDYSLKNDVSESILNGHERYSGDGYPEGLKEDDINPLSRIMSLADAYESLTHLRSWRRAMGHHEAMRHLIEIESPLFDPLVLKKLTEALGIYPPGSILTLSDGSVGEVIKADPNAFTKPLVKVILDRDFKKIKPYFADLSENRLLSIEGAVSAEELAVKNSKFKSFLELSRIWVDW